MRRIAAWLAVACGVIAAPLAAQPKTALPPETPAACRAPLTVLGDVPILTRSAAVAARTRRLKVVAIGSSSTAGAGASDRAHAWPARLEEELKRRLPNAEISVVNLAEMRQTTQQMIARFPAVLEQRPDIVVWEVGTAEAVRHLDVEDFFRTVVQGVETLTARGIDVVLVDPQYTRDTARLITFEPYLNAISRAAQMREVSLFHRHAVMRHWVDSGQFQFDSLRPADFSRVADSAYDCIGRLLAHFIIDGLRVGGVR
jgi:lysophospholipase L1-like esterase